MGLSEDFSMQLYYSTTICSPLAMNSVAINPLYLMSSHMFTLAMRDNVSH